MKFKPLIALLISLSAPLSTWASISNVIIFGDSYSDMGNFPEPTTTLANPNKPVTFSNLNGMVYVPVSNPVVLSAPNVNVHHYPVPNLRNNHLPKQPMLDGKKRMYRSLSWTEFLTTDLYADHRIASPNITPSISVETTAKKFADLKMSVNYAWASATSRSSCTYYGSFNRVPKNLCNENGILNARQNYLRNSSNANLHKIIVPGMRRQIELFLADLKAKKVAVNANTDYVLEIGGNDLLAAAAHFQIANTRQMAANVYYGAYRILSTLPRGHVYIFTFASPDLTPFAGDHRVLGKVALGFAKTYNVHLREITAQLQTLFPGRVSLVDEFQMFQNIAASTQPKYFRKACQLNPTFNCAGYQYWNELHPSSSAEAVFGYDVAKNLAH